MKKRKPAFPELIITDDGLPAILRRLVSSDSLVFADQRNFFRICHLGRAVLVRNNDRAQVAGIASDLGFTLAVAVGGCAALDVARACARGRDVVIVPTILSTSCISVDRSVLSHNGRNRIEKSTMPSRVIVSVPEILGSPPEDVARWTRSGFGDLFTMYSAAIELASKSGAPSTKKVLAMIPECRAALAWVVKKFRGFDRDCIVSLAEFLHESCLVVIRRDSTDLNAAGEHRLYHRLLELRRGEYTSSRPTHGQIVAAGTLIAARIFGEETGDLKIYRDLMAAYRKIGLPTNLAGLDEIGLRKSHLVEGLGDIAGQGTYLGDHFISGDFSVIDRTFS